MEEQFLRRYADLPAAIYLLKEKKITFLDPHSWDDRNDSHYLEVYKRQRDLNTLLAICFTQASETYHHWKVFASGPSGVCIKFKRPALLRSLKKQRDVKSGAVKYLKIRENRVQQPIVDDLPFIKRYGFRDEREYRLIYESHGNDLTKDLPIPLSCIADITISPWVHKNLFKHIKDVLQGISGCKKLDIARSTLISSDEWKAIGGRLRRR